MRACVWSNGIAGLNFVLVVLVVLRIRIAEYDIASLFRVSVLKLFCDQSMREKAWRSRKRGAQAT